VKSSVALGEEERRRLGGFGRGKSVWAEGVRSDFIVPLIPDTSGIRGLAQINPKCVFSLSILFSVVAQSKKVYDLDRNRVLSLFLSNAIKDFLFSKYLAYTIICLLERDKVRQSRLWT